MSLILLADDSAHAQRMGERILREEGYEVVCVTDGETALVRLEDVKPDLVIADALLPGRSGYELCEHVRRRPALSHTRVLLAVGLLEPFDEERARQAGSDGVLRKPFEASMMLASVKPLVEAARIARGVPPVTASEPEPPPLPEIDPTLLRSAVTVAVEAALPGVIDDITRRVIEALEQSGEVRISGPGADAVKPQPPPETRQETVSPAAGREEEPVSAPPVPAPEMIEPEREPEPEPAPSSEPAPAPADAATSPGAPEEPPAPQWRGFHLFR